MLNEHNVRDEYFEWIHDLVSGERFSRGNGYRKLLTFLHDCEFTYFIPHDENRADDGIDLRYRFCCAHRCEDLEYRLSGPCSVLEMMVALAIRCEENIMDDPIIGDRTAQWFWNMIVNMGLGGMTDRNYNEWLANDAMTRLLERDYDFDGAGGLFRVKNSTRDMRDAEIWHQAMAYLNTMT